MIVLTQTTDKIRAYMDQSSTLVDVVVSYKDLTSSGLTPGRKLTTLNGSTHVDISDSPAASTTRVIDYISIYNRDPSLELFTIVEFSDNGTDYILYQASLSPGERVEYTDIQGWQFFDRAGSLVNVTSNGQNSLTTSPYTRVTLGSDVTNNDAVANTIADVTGLSFSVTSGSMYYFKFVIFYTSAATATGSRWAVNCTAGDATNLSFTSEYSLTSTTITRNGNVVAFDTPAAANATSASTTANKAVLIGLFTPNGTGTFIARFASEVSSSAIVAKAGSYVEYHQLN